MLPSNTCHFCCLSRAHEKDNKNHALRNTLPIPYYIKHPARSHQPVNQNYRNNLATTTTTTTMIKTRRPGRPCPPGGRVPSAAEPHSVRPRPARPSPLRYVPGRRQPVGVHARAHKGKTWEEPPRTRRSAIGQRRRRPVTVLPRRRHAKKEHDVLIIAPCLFPNHPAHRRPYPPLPSSPGSNAIGQRQRHAATVRPRHVTFVVAEKMGIGKNTMSYLF